MPRSAGFALASVLNGAVDGVLMQYWLDPVFDPKARVREYPSALPEGIAPKSKPSKSIGAR